MTIEEKRNAIKSYCHSSTWCNQRGCNNSITCPLYKFTDSCFETTDDKIIERNFDLVSKMPDYIGEKETTKHDPVNHPSHYCQEGQMECIDEMILLFGVEAVKHFCLCNAWKYRYRSNQKNGDEDLKKAAWYVNKYRELCNNE